MHSSECTPTRCVCRVKRVQELRRSNAATPQKNKKKYTRKVKNKKAKSLKVFSDLVSPYFA
jgi:hypothetical protein